MRYKHVKSDSAESHATPGGEITAFLATASDTGGRVSIFDSVLPKGNSAPLHYHEVDDEIFYIISGSVEFGVGEDLFTANPGDLVIAGPSVPRRFVALSDSRMLVINSPSGPSEGFLREITSFSSGSPPDESQKQGFVEKYGIHIM